MQRAVPCSVVLLVFGLGALLAACGGEAEPTPPPAAEVWRGTGAVVEVEVSDLHCEGCQTRAVKSLSALAGVASVEADHETDVIRLTLADPAARDASIARIRDEIHAQHWKVVGEDPIPAQD